MSCTLTRLLSTAPTHLAGAHSARMRASMLRSWSSSCMTQASASAESSEPPRGRVQVRMPACRLTRLLGSRHQRHGHSRLRTLAHIKFMSPPGLCHVPRTKGRRPAQTRDHPAPSQKARVFSFQSQESKRLPICSGSDYGLTAQANDLEAVRGWTGTRQTTTLALVDRLIAVRQQRHLPVISVYHH